MFFPSFIDAGKEKRKEGKEREKRGEINYLSPRKKGKGKRERKGDRKGPPPPQHAIHKGKEGEKGEKEGKRRGGK